MLEWETVTAVWSGRMLLLFRVGECYGCIEWENVMAV